MSSPANETGRELGVRSLVSHPPTLEELFLRHYGDALAQEPRHLSRWGAPVSDEHEHAEPCRAHRQAERQEPELAVWASVRPPLIGSRS